ncbi:hypothetical protein [Mycolicibacterium sp. A43C]
MANPAALLHAQLSAWKGSKTFPDTQRHRIAVSHLDSIEELLRQMDDAGLKTVIFWRYFPQWVELTLHMPHGWKTGTTASHRDDSALENLEHLADRFDDLLPKLQEGGLDAVRTYADGVRTLLDDDDSITDEHLRRHLKQVIAHVNWCLDNFDAVGEFSLQEAIERLLAAMIRATVASSRKDRWRDKMNTVVWPFITGTVASIAATPATIAIAAALSG